MNGLLLIDKPAGISSFGALARVRGIISQSTGEKTKVGHAGTLDPFATGLLILLIGNATKQADQFLKLDKTYEAQLTLGKTSTTADPEGDIASTSTKKPPESNIEAVLKRFTGQIEQTPPIFSAIKINGQRAYKLARKGQEVRLKPRLVTVYLIENIVYDYPKLSFTVSVSSGTYIRSLAVDIGEALGTGAYLSSLRRTGIDKYDVDNGLKIDGLTIESISGKVRPLDK